MLGNVFVTLEIKIKVDGERGIEIGVPAAESKAGIEKQSAVVIRAGISQCSAILPLRDQNRSASARKSALAKCPYRC